MHSYIKYQHNSFLIKLFDRAGKTKRKTFSIITTKVEERKHAYLLQVAGQAVVEVLHGKLLIVDHGGSAEGEGLRRLRDASPEPPRASVHAGRAAPRSGDGDSGVAARDELHLPADAAAGASHGGGGAAAGDAAGAEAAALAHDGGGHDDRWGCDGQEATSSGWRVCEE